MAYGASIAALPVSGKWCRAALIRAALMLFAVPVCGCAIKGGSTMDVKRIDSTTFQVGNHVIGSLSGTSGVQAKNDEIATSFCAEKGKPMSVVDRHGYGGVAPQDILTFRCGEAVAVRQHTTKPVKGT